MLWFNQSISYLQWINPYLSCIRRCYSCRVQKECSNNVNITGKNSLSNVQWKHACINHKLRSNSASKSYNSKYVLKNKESFLIQSQNVPWLIFCCRMEKCCSFNQPTRWPCYCKCRDGWKTVETEIWGRMLVCIDAMWTCDVSREYSLLSWGKYPFKIIYLFINDKD